MTLFERKFLASASISVNKCFLFKGKCKFYESEIRINGNKYKVFLGKHFFLGLQWGILGNVYKSHTRRARMYIFETQ